jgi:hypothetical protein
VRPSASEVEYLILRDVNAKPYLLARVLWPQVCQAISAQRPDWKADPGLFDLPYDPSSESVSFEQATRIAADWGARLPSDETPAVSGPPMIRRMPPNWSNLSPAERRAWGLEFVKIGPGKPGAVPTAEEPEHVPSPRRARRPWRQRVRPPALGENAPGDNALEENALEENAPGDNAHEASAHEGHDTELDTELDHTELDHTELDHTELDHTELDHTELDHTELDDIELDHIELDTELDDTELGYSELDETEVNAIADAFGPGAPAVNATPASEPGCLDPDEEPRRRALQR